MVDGRYHHGALRQVLLAEAEQTLRSSGVDGLSLRELARAVGVSHGAPRRHFKDKAALLEAVVHNGFDRLGSVLESAARSDGGNVGQALKSVAVAYVRFASENPALVDLMASSSHLADASGALASAREKSVAPVRHLVEAGQRTGDVGPGDVRRISTIIFATLHGLAMLVNNRMIDPHDVELIGDAVDALLCGLGPR